MTTAPAQLAEVCLHLIASGVDQLRCGNLAVAERAFASAFLASTRGMPAEQGSGLRILAMYCACLSKERQGPADAARPLREQASALLAGTTGAELPAHLVPLFQELMAAVLFDLGEFRRAIPFCEATIQHLTDLLHTPTASAAAMWRAGRCYARVGLRDHAVIPLRQAVKIFRTLAGDPRLPVVLIDLGNALRKSNPAEAEQCYTEAADLHVANFQLQSATTPWMNLGVLCSEQGRYAEALAHYERALKIREQSAGTPPERIGSLLNNISNLHRKMGEFDAAHQFLDRAVRLLEPASGHSLACAYGSRGLTFRDAGRDEEAVLWFRKSSAEHRKQSSPHLHTLWEELEHEAAALTRLGRLEEAADAQHRLDSVRASMAEIAPAGREFADPPLSEGAVLIELNFGSHAGTPLAMPDLFQLRQRLVDALAPDDLATTTGYVTIPETRSCFTAKTGKPCFGRSSPFYSKNPDVPAEKSPSAKSDRHREVLLPGRVM